PRQLDITCCDLEPAILARNIVLFTLLNDGISPTTVWDIFYHLKLTEHVASILSGHARNLVNLSETTQTWIKSKYGSFVKFVDERSLSEVRRYWISYAEFPNLSSIRLDKLNKEQAAMSAALTKILKTKQNIGISRSATVVWDEASQSVSDQFGQYWKHGTTATTNKDIQKTTLLNPMFCYSQAYGETFSGVPNITFPQGFHFAPAFVSVEVDPVGSNVTTAMAKAKQQFKASCAALEAFRKAGALTLRFFALNQYVKTGDPQTEVFAAPWRAAPIDLTEHTASEPKAPLSFDIIDTSTLVRSLGMVNLLLASQPLLKKQTLSQAVLYMDLIFDQDPPSENLPRRLCNDVPTMGLLIGLAPRAYISRFVSQSNTHDLTMPNNTRFYERVAWVDPVGGDKHTYQEPNPTICADSFDLFKIISGVYRYLFIWDAAPLAGIPHFSRYQLLLGSSADYNSETVAALWVHAQSRVHIEQDDWKGAITAFIGVTDGLYNMDNPLSNSSFPEVKLQLHIHGLPMGVHSLRPSEKVPKAGVFETWPDIPQAVCVVLRVPRDRLDPLRTDKEELGPRLVCTIGNFAATKKLTTYSALHAVWGTCVPLHTSGSRFTIEENPDGFRGRSDLVVSFWIDSNELAFPDLELNLAIRYTPLADFTYSRELGKELNLFSTTVNNNDHVLVLRERPMGLARTQKISGFLAPPPSANSDGLKHRLQIVEDGDKFPCYAMLDHVDIEFEDERAALKAGQKVMTTQIGPCTLRMTIGKAERIIRCPYPFRGILVQNRSKKNAYQIR
ncbi:hypothetical protein FRC07_006062, partial [Ceratobasidium sp. 392]